MKIQEAIARQKEPLCSQLRDMFQHFPENGSVILRTVQAGVTIMKEGEPSVTVFLLLEGQSTAFWMDPGHSQYLASHEVPLTFLGDLAALAGFAYHTTSMKTVSKCRFLTMHRDVFMQWMDRDPDIYRSLVQKNLQMLSVQARGSRSAAMQNNDIRILEYLSWRYQMDRTDKNPVVLIRKTREEIAEDIGGVSLRTLNRHLAHIAGEDLITLVKGKVQITQKQYVRIVKTVEMGKY